MVSCDAKGSKVMVIVSAIKCPGCGTILFSRARHDFRQCDCDHQTFIDGGFDYVRAGGKILMGCFPMEVDATKEELYQDWNKYHDKWGKIPKEPS